MTTIGFIGCGKMARAMIAGLTASEAFAAADITVCAPSSVTRADASARFGINVSADNAAAAACDVVVLAVKPQVCDLVLSEVNGIIREDALLVSIAAGKPIAWIASRARTENVARFMPNMPAAVGEGMTSVSFADAVSAADRRTAESIAAAFGRFEVIPESLMDAATALAGSSPAFVFMMIEAMADAAVLEGMPRAQAYRFAAQAVAGSARMALEDGAHPAALKDAVCSPAGTTIEGVRVLEELGFRSSVMEALHATCEKSRDFG
ncbi:pyrroline-5-carboxylate reductase [Slackia exigua]|uniref:pyrroline-5-carboxylate reductase n=1 Tax=Slackia exigua TaxID=84109 RepID=UPI002005E117|nr:pyrroline-5-carboxylate reductase [Slackia exigua]MCK6139413.1 pyrroline-5-carboxylate reductase [Slackia exigua]